MISFSINFNLHFQSLSRPVRQMIFFVLYFFFFIHPVFSAPFCHSWCSSFLRKWLKQRKRMKEISSILIAFAAQCNFIFSSLSFHSFCAVFGLSFSLSSLFPFRFPFNYILLPLPFLVKGFRLVFASLFFFFSLFIFTHYKFHFAVWRYGFLLTTKNRCLSISCSWKVSCVLLTSRLFLSHNAFHVHSSWTATTSSFYFNFSLVMRKWSSCSCLSCSRLRKKRDSSTSRWSLESLITISNDKEVKYMEHQEVFGQMVKIQKSRMTKIILQFQMVSQLRL